jgi:hypothetical protein
MPCRVKPNEWRCKEKTTESKPATAARTESGGAVVYSVGPNGVDDGGGKAFDPQRGTLLDIVRELNPQP